MPVQFNPKELAIDKSVPWQRSGSSSPADISQAILGKYPNGVDAILVAVSMNPGWKEIRQTNGIIAILIGLLVPDIRDLQQQNAKRAHLQSALKAGGKLGLSLSGVDQLPESLPMVAWVGKVG